MSDLILYNKFDSLNEYLKHQQYKYIYQHPLFIKNGNKKGLSFICSKNSLLDIRYHAITVILSSIATILSMGYNTLILTYILSSLIFISVIHGASKFIFTRNKLWKKLEKDFLQENISSKNIAEMMSLLSIEQKEAVLNFVQVKESITFNEMIKMFEFTHNKLEKEKIILTLKE